MTLNDAIHIAVLPGDGIGAEVTQAALPIFNALNLPITLHLGEIGWSCWQQTGNPISQETWQLIRQSDATLIGAITSKPTREALKELAPALQKQKLDYVSPLIQLRQGLQLFANVRPCFNLSDEKKTFNFCVIRENTEGLYAGFDFFPLPQALKPVMNENPRWQHASLDDVSCTLRLQSREGLHRLFEFAFQYAQKNHHARVTFADKPNVLRQSSAFARDIFEGIACAYPHIKADILNVDATAYWLIKRPEEFGVVVAENMFGDILSDVGAAVMGGLGLAPSANIGKDGCYFEPVHGSGLRMKPHTANPSAMFLTISLLLKHFGYTKQAQIIEQAVTTVVREGRFTTYDLGGHHSTEEMAQAIIEKTLAPTQTKASKKNGEISRHQQFLELKSLSSCEISDALDACKIEGALLHIKPLLPGKKLIGPAYTIQYSPYQNKQDNFRQAANYIDQVPEESVIVIDNQGRIDCTVWGGILSQTALLKGIAGTIVNGAVRDINLLRESGYPLYCVDHFMRTAKNRVYKSGEQCPITISGITIHPGDLIFADDNGVLVIPVARLDEIIHKAKNIQKNEKKIIAAVQEGHTLEQARKAFHYDQPWLDEEK